MEDHLALPPHPTTLLVNLHQNNGPWCALQRINHAPVGGIVLAEGLICQTCQRDVPVSLGLGFENGVSEGICHRVQGVRRDSHATPPSLVLQGFEPRLALSWTPFIFRKAVIVPCILEVLKRSIRLIVRKVTEL